MSKNGYNLNIKILNYNYYYQWYNYLLKKHQNHILNNSENICVYFYQVSSYIRLLNIQLISISKLS